MERFTLSPDDQRMLVRLLDAVIPASHNGRLPGACDLDLTAAVVRTIEETPLLRPVVEYGLSALAELGGKRNPAGLGALSRADVTAVLEEFAAGDQFFMPAFLFLAYSTYYQHPRVIEALGLEARPPHPKGHQIAPDDPTVLDPVRRRAAMFRTP